MSFKVGDKVICVKGYVCPLLFETQFTVGSVYIVREEDKTFCLVEKDDLGHTDNGWLNKYFKKMEN